MIISEFQIEHLSQIRHREVFNQQMQTARGLIEKHHSHPSIEMRSILLGDDVVAIMGVSLLWEHVAQIFTLTSDLAYEKPIAFHKAALKLLRYAELEYNLHRVEAHVIDGYPQGRRWAEACGFDLEGILRKFDPHGNDYYLYARVS